MPCNFHLRRISQKVKEGVRDAGGVPIEFNTIAVSDGIAMGTEGMKASLISREVIADSIELVVRGHLLDGVIAATLAELGRHGIRHTRAIVGPHIGPLQYEFGADQLETASAALGPSVSSTTHWGTPSLDLGEATRLELRRHGAVIDSEIGRCTASDERYFSHRARAEQGRTAVLVGLETERAGVLIDD